jgi:putative restriction endonuclease
MPNVSFSQIQVGQSYSRQQLAELWNYKAYQAIARGVVTPAKHSAIILFVTREKQSSAEQYEDRLDGNRLYWEGPTDHFAEERIISSERSADDVHLFYRDRHHSDFGYRGRLTLLEVTPRAARPSSFVFELMDR